jgi:hypothetical protein
VAGQAETQERLERPVAGRLAIREAPPADASVTEAEADARIRTGDPFITSEVLYQLSYVGERVRGRLLMRIRATSVPDFTGPALSCCSQFGGVPSGFGPRLPEPWPKPLPQWDWDYGD